jgi:4-hydroxy-3-polyprenylbenzoate decarboxylase
VALAGGSVLPLNVGYYFAPNTIGDVTNFFVGKILDMLGVENELYAHWKW